MEVTKIGKRGTLVLPAALRRQLGVDEGSLLSAEIVGDGILIRPVAVVPVEVYTAERKAEFLLNNAVDEADYRNALAEVRSLGVNPDHVPHQRPA